ncbi:hypothetical protein AB6A40_010935 [Gnathostoma spinigerum]|uniref:Uncharacterized protein n=1 Tax=Gnathostoma spinigerum TaxID=75299 RepID=A0ABD6EY10_9BILA
MVVNVYATSVTTENLSRNELLAWVNSSLQANISRIEDLSTGEAYCKLTDILFPGKIMLKKVKCNSRNENDWINNWKVLQTSWSDIGIDKRVPVERLLRGKFQDNFEFLQWFRKFFDANCSGSSYVTPGMYSTAATSNNKLSCRKTTTMNISTRSGTTNGRAGSVKTISTSSSMKPPLSPVPNINKQIAEQADRIKELESQLNSHAEAIEALIKERDFYFNKLRQIEDLCPSDGENSQLSCSQIKEILYAVELLEFSSCCCPVLMNPILISFSTGLSPTFERIANSALHQILH